MGDKAVFCDKCGAAMKDKPATNPSPVMAQGKGSVAGFLKKIRRKSK
jgi:hypothetical protein